MSVSIREKGCDGLGPPATPEGYMVTGFCVRRAPVRCRTRCATMRTVPWGRGLGRMLAGYSTLTPLHGRLPLVLVTA